MKTSLFSNISNPNIQNHYSKVASKNNDKISFGVKTLPLAQDVFPDLKQFLIPQKRKFCCGPVSVANGIIMLSKKGFPNLFQSGDFLQLIEELAKFFKTTKQGTTMNDYCTGLENFVHAKGYESEIDYDGFREVSSKYKSSDIPDLEKAKKEVEEGKAVFMNVGFYEEMTKGKKNIFKRNGGHYVSVVGGDNNGVGYAPDYLTIHDPYNKISGDCFAQTEKIQNGRFIHNFDDNEGTVTENAKDFYKIGPFNYIDSNQIGIVNGIVTLGVK